MSNQPIETFADVVNRLNGLCLRSVTSNGSFVTLPGGAVVLSALFTEIMGIPLVVTLGSTPGAADIMPAQTVPANGQLPATALSFLQIVYPADQSVFLSAASWGGASVNFKVWYVQ